MVVVGLGNPGDQFTGTPHNVGHRVADVLAAKSSAEWEDIGEAWAARLETQAGHILVLKLRSQMNYSGVALRTLSRRLDFINTDCVLVYDDADLPLGKPRTKIAGSSGGHRGVSNIIEEFQTDQFRRVKVGVRPMDGSKATREYLLTPMSEADRSIIAAACEQAASKVWELVPERSAEVG
jgi:PTH1 family peptidyl-tRNA hydrolase